MQSYYDKKMIKRFCLRLKAIILRADRQILYFKDYYDSSQIFPVASIHFFFRRCCFVAE